MATQHRFSCALVLALSAIACGVTHAQLPTFSIRKADVGEAAMLLVAGSRVPVPGRPNLPYDAVLYSAANSGDCDPRSEVCSEDWFLAINEGVAGGRGVVFFLGAFGHIVEPR